MNKRLVGPTTRLFPMPVLLLCVTTGSGPPSILTLAWAGIIGNGPSLIALRIGGFHYSTPFIDKEMSFTLNVPSSEQIVGADYCGTVSGRDDPDKARTCGWTLAPASQITSPTIASCPVSFECRVVDKKPAGRGAIYTAEILETHIDERLFDGQGKIDVGKLDPVVYAPDGNYYRLGEKLGEGYKTGGSLKARP